VHSLGDGGRRLAAGRERRGGAEAVAGRRWLLREEEKASEALPWRREDKGWLEAAHMADMRDRAHATAAWLCCRRARVRPTTGRRLSGAGD
jgi:hypothetical protein